MSEWDPNFFHKEDEEKLELLGYKQQLLRNLRPIHNFGISFSVLSVPISVTLFFQYGLSTGGPATMVISWTIVAFFSFCVALSMGEIVSALPTSGGPYFWAAILAPPKYSAFASWIAAWFNLIGLVAGNTSSAYGLCQLISAAATVKTDYVSTPGKDIGICAVILASWALMNSYGRPILRHILYLSVAVNTLGVMAFIIAILVKAPYYQSSDVVFRTFIDSTSNNGGEGWGTRVSPAYVACIGGLLGLSSFFGYDASAHVAEETMRAAWVAPLGIIAAVGLSGLIGLGLMISLLFTMTDFLDVATNDYGQPVLQILIDLFGIDGALVLFMLPIICLWFCGVFWTMSNSRMAWAFSRDRGIPYYFSKIDERSMSPIRAVLLCTSVSFLLVLPSLGSVTVLSGVTSIGVIGVLISYGIPISLHLVHHSRFLQQRGPFHLGAASRPLALVSVLWIGLACVVLCLPTTTPVTPVTVNYASIATVATGVGAVGFWMCKGKRYFIGPIGVSGTAIDISGLMERSADRDEK